jgi:RNA polymerase sigma factor (sigma-70 family)
VRPKQVTSFGTRDQSSLEDLVHTEYPRLVAAVTCVTGSVPLAEDAVQEALARAWESERRGVYPTHLGAWVVTVALNLARSSHRRRRAERRAYARTGPPATATSQQSLAMEFVSLVEDLPLRQRQVVTLHYLLDVDVQSMADVLGVSTGTVKTALSRARSRLATQLEDGRDG